MKKVLITILAFIGAAMAEDEKEINQPFEANYPYKETGTIKVNANKKEWVRRVGDTVGGTLRWTFDGQYAVLYKDLGGTQFFHYFFCFKDDGTGWMDFCSEHYIRTDYLLQSFAIKDRELHIQLETKRSRIYIAPYKVSLEGASSKIKISTEKPNEREVRAHQAGAYPNYVNFGTPPKST